ncbi:MAG: DUF3524 domain-containing protein [bacterium]
MNILILEPYLTGSHKAWAEGYQKYSRHRVEILSLSGHFWKWRMHGGAVTLVKKYVASEFKPDVLLATDMLDLSTFLALTREHTTHLPTALYFHENQLSYPWSPEDRDVQQKRDKHYGFINYVSALCADAVFFNSFYHQNSFLSALKPFLKHFPDHNDMENVEKIKQKSQVLPLGLDLRRFDRFQPFRKTETVDRAPLILWNHRWEYDKNPGDFFRALIALAEKGLSFKVAILGERFSEKPAVFTEAREKLSDRIVQFGYVENFRDYATWLWESDILPVTCRQDFFGASVVEALYCGCFPILPKRLAYPEIVPEDRQSAHFYTDFEDLTSGLENALFHVQALREKSMRGVVKKYDWQVQSPKYDRQFEDITRISTRCR